MKLFLDVDELHELTGYVTSCRQIEWLRRRGWRHEVNSAGRPKVARAYFERRMVGEVQAAEPGPAARHNFGALRVVK